MNRVQRILSALLALGLTAMSVLLGLAYLPALGAAREAGTFVPWLIAWLLIGVAALSGLAIAGFLLSSSGETRGAHPSR